MARRSLTASKQGITKAKARLTKMAIRQKDLQQQVGCSRQPLTNFFAGKAIVQELFVQICDRLDLDWQEIAGLSSTPASAENLVEASNNWIDHLVVQAREQIGDRLREVCGTMRVLDMTKPVGIDQIYTRVNVLEKIPSSTYKSIEDIVRNCDPNDAESFARAGLGKIVEEKIPGLDAVKKYQKLIILGKPGSGKTTFLKHLAIQSINGQFKSDLVPIFVTLKNFAEAHDHPDLIEYMSRGNVVNYIPAISQKQETEKYKLFYQIIKQGRALILLDGLDEVNQEDSQRILETVSDFYTQFYQNHFVIACRIAAWEKNYRFARFTEVEIADFDQEQIDSFARSWFADNHSLAKDFLLCLEAEERHHIKQLARNPLLLTLLCLVYGSSGHLPNNHSQLYQEGINILLSKWDIERGIERDCVYQRLSTAHKEHLLSQIAATTFEQKKYFFEQQTVVQYISDYISNLANVDKNTTKHTASSRYQWQQQNFELEQNSLGILHSIEAQHGILIERAKNIYSFSHLSFQEYFVARDIINSPERNLKLLNLLDCLTNPRWREVILLVVEMLPDATIFLQRMKVKVDTILAENQSLQNYLKDLNQQAESIRARFNLLVKYLPAIRAFLFDPDFDIDQNRRLAVGIDSVVNLFVCASFFARVLQNTDLAKGINLAQTYDTQSNGVAKISTASSANAAMLIAIEIALASEKIKPEVITQLKLLIDQYNREQITLNELADSARQTAKNNEQILKEFPSLKHWQFNDKEKTLRQKYYYANTLLIECLNRCQIKSQASKQIRESILQPIAAINPDELSNNNELQNSLPAINRF